jgi:uncharacterized protein (DUF305 family)
MHHTPGKITRTSSTIVFALAAVATLTGARSYESPLLAECHDAMSTMMHAMHAPSHGDADADFAAMMVPHHEGAIAMAKAELRYGKNQQLRRLAQEIIVTQAQEIAVMRNAEPEAFANDTTSGTGAVR